MNPSSAMALVSAGVRSAARALNVSASTAASAVAMLMVFISRSVDFLKVRQLPCLIEEGLLRAIEAEPDEPSFRRTGIHPVALQSRRRFRAEVEIRRAIGVESNLVVGTDRSLVGLVHGQGTGEVVIDGDGPELVDGDVGRDVQLVVFR